MPLLLYNLPVYCGMYDKYKNITWLQQNEEDNLKIIKSLLPSALFDISVTDDENKITINYVGDKQLNNGVISIKDIDSRACIYSNKFNTIDISCYLIIQNWWTNKQVESEGVETDKK